MIGSFLVSRSYNFSNILIEEYMMRIQLVCWIIVITLIY